MEISPFQYNSRRSIIYLTAICKQHINLQANGGERCNRFRLNGWGTLSLSVKEKELSKKIRDS